MGQGNPRGHALTYDRIDLPFVQTSLSLLLEEVCYFVNHNVAAAIFRSEAIDFKHKLSGILSDSRLRCMDTVSDARQLVTCQLALVSPTRVPMLISHCFSQHVICTGSSPTISLFHHIKFYLFIFKFIFRFN